MQKLILYGTGWEATINCEKFFPLTVKNKKNFITMLRETNNDFFVIPEMIRYIESEVHDLEVHLEGECKKRRTFETQLKQYKRNLDWLYDIWSK